MEKLLKKIKIYLFPPDDWLTLRCKHGRWEIFDDGTFTKNDNCMFMILYSKHRNKLKFNTTGYRPHKHRLFPIEYTIFKMAENILKTYGENKLIEYMDKGNKQ